MLADVPKWKCWAVFESGKKNMDFCQIRPRSLIFKNKKTSLFQLDDFKSWHTLPPMIMDQWKTGVSPIGSLPFKYSHFPLGRKSTLPETNSSHLKIGLNAPKGDLILQPLIFKGKNATLVSGRVHQHKLFHLRRLMFHLPRLMFHLPRLMFQNSKASSMHSSGIRGCRRAALLAFSSQLSMPVFVWGMEAPRLEQWS